MTVLAGAAQAEQAMLARVTVYWAQGGSGSDKWTRNHQTATRVRLRPGHCAVDPRRIPYGSKVTLPDATLLAVDTGKHVRTRRAARRSGRSTAERNAIVIDRFFETKKEALRWARKHPHFMVVRVHSPNERVRLASQTATNVAVTRTATTVRASSAGRRIASEPARVANPQTAGGVAPKPSAPRDRRAGAYLP